MSSNHWTVQRDVDGLSWMLHQSGDDKRKCLPVRGVVSRRETPFWWLLLPWRCGMQACCRRRRWRPWLGLQPERHSKQLRRPWDRLGRLWQTLCLLPSRGWKQLPRVSRRAALRAEEGKGISRGVIVRSEARGSGHRQKRGAFAKNLSSRPRAARPLAAAGARASAKKCVRAWVVGAREMYLGMALEPQRWEQGRN
jgi:hypothetical protein